MNVDHPTRSMIGTLQQNSQSADNMLSLSVKRQDTENENGKTGEKIM
jgi:hypothetical protein